MQINQKKAEEYVPELSLPMLKSQSLGTLEQRSPKNSISSMLKKSNKKKQQKSQKKLKQSFESIQFSSLQQVKPKKSIISIQIQGKEPLRDQLKKINHMIRQKKLQQSYNTIDLWKSKYSLQMRKNIQNAKKALTKIQEKRLQDIRKHEQSIIQRQKHKQRNLEAQLEHIKIEEQKKSDFQKKFQKLLKNSPNSKSSGLIPSLIEFQVRKANYSKMKKKKKVTISDTKTEQMKIKPIKLTQQQQQQEIKKSLKSEEKKVIQYFKQGQLPTKWQTNMNRYDEEQQNLLFEKINVPSVSSQENKQKIQENEDEDEEDKQ